MRLNVIDHVTGKDEWLTPQWIVKALGEFDLDPCSPINRPWDTAKKHLTIHDDGLMSEWFGRVWMNPPYGKALIHWLNKICLHNNGIALTMARMETNAFHKYVYPHVDSMFFFKQRLTFLNVDGTPGKGNAGAPSVLLAYGGDNSDSITDAGFDGYHLPVNKIGIVLIGYDVTWKMVINSVFVRLNRPAELSELYDQVEKFAGDKVQKNPNFKAKVRQVVQKHFNRVGPAKYSRNILS